MTATMEESEKENKSIVEHGLFRCIIKMRNVDNRVKFIPRCDKLIDRWMNNTERGRHSIPFLYSDKYFWASVRWMLNAVRVISCIMKMYSSPFTCAHVQTRDSKIENWLLNDIDMSTNPRVDT